MSVTQNVTRLEYARLLDQLKVARGRLAKAESDKALAHESSGDPDMHENAAAEQAYEEIRKWGTEVARLQRIINESKVVEVSPADDGTVQIGSTVTVLIDHTDEYTKVLAGSQGLFGEGQISSSSKLGQAIVGQRVGYETTYQSGSDDNVHVKILNVVNK